MQQSPHREMDRHAMPRLCKTQAFANRRYTVVLRPMGRMTTPLRTYAHCISGRFLKTVSDLCQICAYARWEVISFSESKATSLLLWGGLEKAVNAWTSLSAP